MTGVALLTEPSEGGIETGYAGAAARGIAWSLSGLLVAEPLRVVVTVVLARVLTPEDFGLVAMASVTVGLLTIGNDLGLQSAIIQRRACGRDELDSLFWFNLVAGTLFALSGALLAVPVANAFNEPRIAPLIAVMSVGMLLVSLVQVQNAMVRRDLNFRLPAVANLVGVVFGGVCAIIAALLGLGVWSLVINTLAAITASALIVQLGVRYRPRLHYRWGEIDGFVIFGSQLMGAELTQYGATNIDNAVIGRFMGAEALGPYALSYNLVTYPTRRLATVIASVTFPAMSRMQHDTQRIWTATARTLSVSSALVFPLIGAAAVVADGVIIGLYGGQWQAAVQPFRILCFAALARSVAVHCENVFRSLGKGRAILAWSTFFFAVVSFGSFFAVQGGVVAVATAVAAATLLVTVGELLHAGRLLGEPISSMPRTLLWPVLIGIVAAGGTKLAYANLQTLGPLGGAVGSMLFGLAVSLALTWKTPPIKDLRELVSRLR